MTDSNPTTPIELCPQCGEDTVLRHDIVTEPNTGAEVADGEAYGHCTGCEYSYGRGDTRTMGAEGYRVFLGAEAAASFADAYESDKYYFEPFDFEDARYSDGYDTAREASIGSENDKIRLEERAESARAESKSRFSGPGKD